MNTFALFLIALSFGVKAKAFAYGAAFATVAIIIAEIVGNYGLGDVVKDKINSLLHGAEDAAQAKLARLRFRVTLIEIKAKKTI